MKKIFLSVLLISFLASLFGQEKVDLDNYHWCVKTSIRQDDTGIYRTELKPSSNLLVMEFQYLDHPFQIVINGIDVAGTIQFDRNEDGNLAVFTFDGSTFGEDKPRIEDYYKSLHHRVAVIRILVDENGVIYLYGAPKDGAFELLPMALKKEPKRINWLKGDSNIIEIVPEDKIKTSLVGRFYECNHEHNTETKELFNELKN